MFETIYAIFLLTNMSIDEIQKEKKPHNLLEKHRDNHSII